MFAIPKFKRLTYSLTIVIAVMLSSCQQDELFENQFTQDSPLPNEFVDQEIEGQYIVVFKEAADLKGTNSINATFSYTSKLRSSTIEAAQIKDSEVLVHLDGAINGFAAKLSAVQVKQLMENPYVAYLEKDRYISLRKERIKEYLAERNIGKGKVKILPPPVPIPVTNPAPTPIPIPTPVPPTNPTSGNDYKTISPLAGETVPWHIERVGYGDGTGKTVWIIDSGIATTHADLNIDLKRSVSFIYGNSSIEDGFGHGTAVAGIIGAKNNGSGLIGIASNATIVALRVFDDTGQGTVSRAISAVNHASMYANAGDVINMSLGTGISSTLDNAVRKAAEKGVLFAVAAGNTGVDCSNYSPARVDAPGIYTISAMDSYNRLWESSNYGPSVDFAAPGVNISILLKEGKIGGGGKGTSFAAPHVAGILLLRGKVFTQGTITGDKDDTPDPIASLR